MKQTLTNLRMGILSAVLMAGLFTGCTGTSEPEVPSKVLVMDQTERAVAGDPGKADRVTFKVLRLAEGRPVLRSIERPGVATGLQSLSDGSKILAGFTNRVEVYVPQDDKNNTLDSLKLDTGTQLPEGTFTVKSGTGARDHLCTGGTLTLDKPQLNANGTFWVVMSTCNQTQTPADQKLWLVSLSTGNVELLFDNNDTDVITDYAAGSNNVLFAQRRPGTSDHFINGVSYGVGHERQIDIGNTLSASSGLDLEVWKEGTYAADTLKISQIKTIKPLSVQDFLAYSAINLIRRQDQMLAVTSSSACLLGSAATCLTPQLGQINIAGIRDVAFDLSGYAWILTSSTLYRVDIQSAQKESSVESSESFKLTDARGVAWLVNQ